MQAGWREGEKGLSTDRGRLERGRAAGKLPDGPARRDSREGETGTNRAASQRKHVIQLQQSHLFREIM